LNFVSCFILCHKLL